MLISAKMTGYLQQHWVISSMYLQYMTIQYQPILHCFIAAELRQITEIWCTIMETEWIEILTPLLRAAVDNKKALRSKQMGHQDWLSLMSCPCKYILSKFKSLIYNLIFIIIAKYTLLKDYCIWQLKLFNLVPSNAWGKCCDARGSNDSLKHCLSHPIARHSRVM